LQFGATRVPQFLEMAYEKLFQVDLYSGAMVFFGGPRAVHLTNSNEEKIFHTTLKISSLLPPPPPVDNFFGKKLFRTVTLQLLS
jgi:hypothetical protein